MPLRGQGRLPGALQQGTQAREILGFGIVGGEEGRCYARRQALGRIYGVFPCEVVFLPQGKEAPRGEALAGLATQLRRHAAR